MSTSAVLCPACAIEAATLQATVVEPHPPIVGITCTIRARLPIPCELATRSTAAANFCSTIGSGMNSRIPTCIASISTLGSSTWLITKKFTLGYCRGRCDIFRRLSIAPGSRLMITSCGASGRASTGPSTSRPGSCATTFTPSPDRNPASSWRFVESPSMITLFSCRYMWAFPCRLWLFGRVGPVLLVAHRSIVGIRARGGAVGGRGHEPALAVEPRGLARLWRPARCSPRRSRCRAVRGARVAAEVAVEEQLELVGVAPVLAGQRGHLAGIERLHDVRRDEHDQLGLLALVAHRAEQRAEHRQVA